MVDTKSQAWKRKYVNEPRNPDRNRTQNATKNLIHNQHRDQDRNSHRDVNRRPAPEGDEVNRSRIPELNPGPPTGDDIQQRLGQPGAVDDVTKTRPAAIHVLALKWQDSEAKKMKPPYDLVCRVFSEELGYDVTKYDIPRKDATQSLRLKVAEFLPPDNSPSSDTYIIYYIGHGGRGSDESLSFFSHRGETEEDLIEQFQEDGKKAGRVRLPEVLTRLPQCDLALILDCCYAGAAFNDIDTTLTPNHLYQVLAASTAYGKTWDGQFSKRMCEFLQRKRKERLDKVSIRAISGTVRNTLQLRYPRMGPSNDEGHHNTVIDHPKASHDDAIKLPLDLPVPRPQKVIDRKVVH
ncbi:uncharacterized protein PV06_09123 [Exophiala oligosperma]|uniref:Uncharacterized protein n=1 Tax=Exophiala oligosperma TaxID=215243 RepID=A0A0D2DA53_9EURO|nr:uncharacterized protein PV06_09123 [Exophiala oligosperma]KIW39345.1 hypothetical protein PV06_09123 [Exophiala oligosperma]